MPNYRYNSPDNLRRNNYGRQVTLPATYAEQSRSTCCNDCCEDSSRYDELSHFPIAMAYVPWQVWRNLYEARKGLSQGTIFEDLDKPFLGGRCCR